MGRRKQFMKIKAGDELKVRTEFTVIVPSNSAADIVQYNYYMLGADIK
jgi:hypothetical protein